MVAVLGEHSLLHNPGLSGANAGDSVDGHPTMIYAGRGYYSSLNHSTVQLKTFGNATIYEQDRLIWEKVDVALRSKTNIHYVSAAGWTS